MFTSEEELTGSDRWYCGRCKKFRDATKKFDLWKLPVILIVHLKRFKYNRYAVVLGLGLRYLGPQPRVHSRGRRSKITTPVRFPTSGLDLSSFLVDSRVARSECVFDLYAVSNHHGGMGGGHYTAHARNPVTGQW